MSTKMNPEVKALWVKALRSGEYKQGKGRLRVKNQYGETSFCCLGVLCNLHAQAHPEIAAKEDNPYRYLGENGILPKQVVQWAGCDLNKVQVLIGETFAHLDSHNDGYVNKGHTFKEIADAIEKQL